MVPSEQVAFRVTVSGADAEAEVAAIRESLRILPEGYTAAPLSYGGRFPGEAWEGMPPEYVEQLAAAIEEAGLQVGIVTEYRAGLEAGSFLGSDPALGSPLELGDTVSLTVSTDRQDQPPAEPRLTVPSVFAYDAASAEQLLTEAGLEVTRQPLHSCLAPRRAVRTTPAAGTLVRPGDPVTLVVTVPHPTAFCVFPDALIWELLDSANGRGPAPSFAAEVTVFVDGQRTTMTGAEASDLENWRPNSALTVLAEATRQQVVTDDFTSTARMKLEPDEGPEFTCGGHVTPRELEGRESLWFNIAIPTHASRWVLHLCRRLSDRRPDRRDRGAHVPHP